MIQNPARLTLEKAQLKLDNQEGSLTLPLEDITALILESPQITLTSAVLAACQQQGVAVITTDSTHMPNGTLLPFLPHSRQSQVAHCQQTITDGVRQRLWQRIIQSKITNQAACLTKHRTAEEATRLYALAQRVEVGDSGNIEAQAAREYWPKLLGKDFRRSGTDSVNAALNYGYAVVRAFVARSQVAYGLIPTFGLHHHSELNAFNLTDDLMEVLRPWVDDVVCALLKEGKISLAETQLSKEVRQQLANMGNALSFIEGKTQTLATTSDVLAYSLINAIEGRSAQLLCLPLFTQPAEKSEQKPED